MITLQLQVIKGNKSSHVESLLHPQLFLHRILLAEVTVDLTMNYIGLGELSAADSVGIESVTNDKPITFPFGSTTITWTVTDTSGNISQATQVVTLVDTTDPEIFAPSDIVAEATSLSGTMIELGEATAHDGTSVIRHYNQKNIHQDSL